MSADNWTTCPRCEEKAAADKAKRRKDAERSYGKVPADEYARLLAVANEKVELGDTLREDYSIGLHEGKFYVSYRASCQVCAFVFRFKDERPIPTGT